MSAAGLVLGLVAIPWAGGLAAAGLWPGRAKPLALLAALAWPLGLTLTSAGYFLWLAATGGRAAGYLPAEGLALLLATGLAWRARRRRRWILPRRPRAIPERLLVLLALAAVALALGAVIRTSAVMPWGYWDAWARINLKARFLAAGGPHWTWVFEGADVPHHDYPLLLECSVARLWRASAFASGALGFGALAPQALGIASWLACLAAAFALAARLRSPAIAALTILAVLSERSGTRWAAMQYADFALATSFLWGAGLLVLARRRRRQAPSFGSLVGACAASAAWCKNEGLSFAVLLLALALLSAARGTRLRWARGLAAGFLAFGLAWIVLELGFAGESSVFGPRTHSVLADLVDGSRYRVLGDFALEFLQADWIGAAALALALAWLLRPRQRACARAWQPVCLCALQLLVYAFVLLTTREDLAWHVGTAADRLVLQLWPLALLGVVAALRSG